MRPRRLYWKTIATREKLLDPDHMSYLRNEIRQRLKGFIADESIEIAMRKRDDGCQELTAELYILTDKEMEDFISHVKRQVLTGMPIIL